MIRRLGKQDGWGLITAIWTMMIMIGIGLALFAFVDGQSRASASERDSESAFQYSDALLNTHAFVLTESWPYTSAQALPDCIYNGSTMTAVGGTATVFSCPQVSEMTDTFTSSDYSGKLTWTSRPRDNGGTAKCAVTNQMRCSYFYDDTSVLGQPSWDANGDGQMWIRSQVILRGMRRTVVQRIQLDRQPVDFPEAVITAGHLTMKDSPHIKVVTQFSPINLRCAAPDAAGCFIRKKNWERKQIAPYKISFAYPGQTAIPSTSLNALRDRAKTEGWWYSTCPVNPPGQQVFVESGNCTGTSLPYTSPTQKGTYIQANGTLKISGNNQPRSANASKGRKGNYWGLIYMANGNPSGTHLTGDVLTIDKGKRLISGVVAVDYGGGFNLGGSKDTLLQYDPFTIQGLYLYQGTAVVRPSFRIITTQTP